MAIEENLNRLSEEKARLAEEKAKKRKDNLTATYQIMGIVGTIIGVMFLVGEKLGYIGAKVEEQSVRIENVEKEVGVVKNDVGETKKEVLEANVKLDTLLQKSDQKERVYTRVVEYPANTSKPVRSTEISNTPISDNPEKPVNMPVEVEEEEEQLFVTSDKHERKEALKKIEQKKKNIQFVMAVFYGSQKIGNNSTVNFRFPEDVTIGGNEFERNTSFRGVARKDGEKFFFEINDINDVTVSCKVYDTYKIEGLNANEIFKDNQKILIGFDY